jgi:hypothetical protein
MHHLAALPVAHPIHLFACRRAGEMKAHKPLRAVRRERSTRNRVAAIGVGQCHPAMRELSSRALLRQAKYQDRSVSAFRSAVAMRRPDPRDMVRMSQSRVSRHRVPRLCVPKTSRGHLLPNGSAISCVRARWQNAASLAGTDRTAKARGRQLHRLVGQRPGCRGRGSHAGDATRASAIGPAYEGLPST